MPVHLKYQPEQNRPWDRKKILPILFPIIVLIALFAFILASGKNEHGNSSPTVMDLTQPQIIVSPSTSATMQLTDTVTNEGQVPETLTPFDLSTPTISSSAVLLSLEMPIGNKYKFVIHRIASGETLAMLAQEYGTTPEDITRVNYRLPRTIWEGYLIIIPLNNEDLGEPLCFEAYVLSENSITLEQLAKKLNYDLDLLATYNGIDGDYLLSSGDWLLFPHFIGCPSATP